MSDRKDNQHNKNEPIEEETKGKDGMDNNKFAMGIASGW